MGKERERHRIKSRVDELPEDVRARLDEMLANVNYTYEQIAAEITSRGHGAFRISKSSVGRYALNKNAAARRLKEAYEKTRLLVQTVKENQNIEASDAAETILINALTERLATAEDEWDRMPLDKVGRLLVYLQRSIVHKEKFRAEQGRLIKQAVQEVKDELAKELKRNPDLHEKICRLLDEKIVSRLEDRDG
jgi:hypothetical protein